MISLRAILRILAALLLIISVFIIFPIIAAFVYGEKNALSAFFITFFVFIGCALIIKISVGQRRDDEVMSTKSGLIFVSLSWLIISAMGSIPFILAGNADFVDAFFETASGFTTTGATIYKAIEILPKSVLLWRGMTNWLGGMGIVVLTVALMPFLSIGGVRLVKAETPGHDPTHLSFHMTRTAKYLWLIYLSLTLIEFGLLMLFGMPAFEALCYSLSTLSTGGFAPRTDSVAGYNSEIQIVITIFMFLGGVNFSLYFWLLKGNIKSFWQDTEFKAYTLVFFILSLGSAIVLYIKGIYGSFFTALHHSSFQIASILTTTGFVITNYELWPSLCVTFIFIAMACGGCIGSTSGGMKISRIVVLTKQTIADLKSSIYPNGFFRARINGHFVSNPILAHVSGFAACYLITLFILTVIVSANDIPLMDSLATSLSALGNIGPGLGITGPSTDYGKLPDHLKIILGIAMIVGRLEISTVLAIFLPTFWKKWGD